MADSADRSKKEPMSILRVDSGKPRRASIEFKFLVQGEPTSPQPSVDRLSVTFAEDSVRSDSSTKCNYQNPTVKMDKVHFPQGTGSPFVTGQEAEESDEEDYSASVNAIILRRASTKKSRRRSTRRASSPFSPDILPGSDNGRRRSSVFTTSSGDTAITMDETMGGGDVTQEDIFENIKLHKEVLSNVKMQPFTMRKKLKLVMQAKNYIKKHEGALQERLAQSHSTRDMLARWNIYLIQKWQRYRRELANLSNWFIPWELKIKEIESHFGSVVASYFIFLRWLFWVNTVLAIVLISFVALPEMLTANPDAAGGRKFVLPEDKYNSTNFLTLWDFEGVFKYSPLFYGWYTNNDSNKSGYRLPFAYFVTGLLAYAYSFFATLRKMAENSRMSKLSEKDDECIFSWKLFTAWDYMIGNAETAHNRVASIVVGFKEALLEEAEKKRQSRNWKITASRILVNTFVLGLLFLSAFAVIMVVRRSKEPDASATVWRRNEITVVMSLISLFFPMIFEVLGLLEQYHPRKQLRLQLARIMVLNLLNLYSLIFALFDKIDDMTTELDNFKNRTANSDAMTSTTPFAITDDPLAYSTFPMNCNCHDLESDNLILDNLMSKVADNITASPTLRKILNFINDTLLESSSELAPTNSSELFENQTSSYSSERSKDFFVDVLNYYLNGMSSDNSSDSIPINDSVTYDYFTTTMSPMEEESLRFDQDQSTDVENITSTIISTIEDNITSRYNCDQICSTSVVVDRTSEKLLNYTTRRRLRSLCWETMFGQELIKLTVMDMVMTVLSTLAMDFLRGIFVRFMNRCWCWDLEKTFPQYADFKVAENILHLVNNQGMVWMGMFFSPGLVVLNTVKLYAMMYFRTWTVLTCNVPHEIIFRASRSNNFYYSLLLMMLFLCVLPVGYAIVWITPSWHCGPFSGYDRIFHIFTKTIKRTVPEPIERALDYVTSPGIVIPLLLLLILIIYYLVSLTGALRDSNNDLKIQLRKERTEERRKMFQIADRRVRGNCGGSGDYSNNPFGKWKQLISNIPNSGKSFDDTPRQESSDIPEVKEEKPAPSRSKDFFSKFMKKTLKKSSTSDECNPESQNLDDGTDTEQHESLPEDSTKEWKPQVNQKQKSGSFDFKKTASLLLQKKNSQKGKTEEKNVRGSPPRYIREDSSSSVWSDNIPVIRISKTESAECLEEVPEPVTPMVEIERVTKFQPKIKYALKKQCSEIDEDAICYFHDDLQRQRAERSNLDEHLHSEKEDSGTKSESSEESARESSADTVLNAVSRGETADDKECQKEEPQTSFSNGSATESSSEYKEMPSL